MATNRKQHYVVNTFWKQNRDQEEETDASNYVNNEID